jgi:hypothetical protein
MFPIKTKIQGVTKRCGQTLGTSSMYENKEICSYQHVSRNISFMSYSWKSTLIILVQISSTRFNAGLDMSRHGLHCPFRDVDVDIFSCFSICDQSLSALFTYILYN